MAMKVKIEESWNKALAQEWDKPYFARLAEFVRKSYGSQTVYPPASKIFATFNMTPLSKVKVVIIGQDPYHGPGQANGLSFSVNDNVEKPPSLQNVFKEIESDLGIRPQASGNLERWAAQGVMLLNATLTVEAGKPGSHQGKGWEEFTDNVIAKLNDSHNLVFMLWGNYAQHKGEIIDRSRHLVLTAPHPSPLSAHRGFFGCRHFSKANDYLIKHGKEPIDWS